MIGWLLIAQAVTAAPGPVPIASVAQAKALPPAALADMLLAPGHPPVDRADVAPPGMVPPPPPGAPPQFRVVLYTQPAVATEPGFCTRMRIHTVVRDPGGNATVEVGAMDTLHRLGTACPRGKADYGTYVDAASLAAIRDLDRARRARRPSLVVDYADSLPGDFDAPRYASGIAALRAVDFGQIHWAGPASRAGSVPEAQRRGGDGSERVGFYAGLWSGVVTREAGRITRVWLERAISPPF